jgi:small nuclear ribonucleoprotein (snRNP)-like protein
MEEIKYNLEVSLMDNLNMFKGKYVKIILNSGQVINGNLKEVKNNLVHVEKIAERNYFDALIRLEEVAAMEAQFRGFKS